MPDRQRRHSLAQAAMATVIAGSMVGAFAAVGGLGGTVNGQVAMAESTTICKPGNGFGDKNHCHFGPPGQTMTTTGTTTTGTGTNNTTTENEDTAGTTDTENENEDMTGTTTTGTRTTGTTTTGTKTTGTTTTGTTTTTESTTSSTTTQCKPGNGFGDKNHCHSGPPGHKKHHNNHTVKH